MITELNVDNQTLKMWRHERKEPGHIIYNVFLDDSMLGDKAQEQTMHVGEVSLGLWALSPKRMQQKS